MPGHSVRRLLLITGVLIAGAGGLAAAQSSPQYRITESSVVATAGDMASPQYQARVTGGDGAPAQTASSPQYAVVLGSTDQPPIDATEVFDSGFE